MDRLSDLANEIVDLQCDVIFAAAPYAILAAMKATTTIPIIEIDLRVIRWRTDGSLVLAGPAVT